MLPLFKMSSELSQNVPKYPKMSTSEASLSEWTCFIRNLFHFLHPLTDPHLMTTSAPLASHNPLSTSSPSTSFWHLARKIYRLSTVPNIHLHPVLTQESNCYWVDNRRLSERLIRSWSRAYLARDLSSHCPSLSACRPRVPKRVQPLHDNIL